MALRLKASKGAAIVRKHLPDIEDALTDGATRQEVHEALQKDFGLTLTYDSFLSALKRARQMRGEQDSSESESDTPLDSKPAPKPKEESKASPAAKKPDPPKRTGIIGTKDFRPSDDIDDALQNISRKRYD